MLHLFKGHLYSTCSLLFIVPIRSLLTTFLQRLIAWGISLWPSYIIESIPVGKSIACPFRANMLIKAFLYEFILILFWNLFTETMPFKCSVTVCVTGYINVLNAIKGYPYIEYVDLVMMRMLPDNKEWHNNSVKNDLVSEQRVE